MKRRTGRLRQVFVACVAVLAVAVTPIAAGSTPANAAVVGFSPGNIISDSVFYNGNAMSASEVQSFLNQRVPRCTIGDPGRAAWTPWGSTFIASVCLKDAYFATTSRAANAYCAAYPGSTWESTSSIIAKVSQACGINPQVLLVMLEKEQSLVSDTFPTARQYNFAMGYACPDSGPNNSANCDPSQTGFFQQVYRAAWQLKVYRAFPGSYNYKPFQTNTIQWHPNAGCGTSQVYIENWATAALYIYTPYRPNQAALNAGWGTGDACSSYGNRNFYNFFTSWFGSTQGFSVWGDIATYWNARTGAESIYGYPTSNSSLRTTKFPEGVWLQTFAGGIITTEMNTGKTVGVPHGAVYNHWNANGGVFGQLGAPVGEPTSYLANGGGVLQWFQGGLMVTSVPQASVASIPYGEVFDFYNDVLGGIYGELGYPTGAFGSYSGGELQNFQHGVIARATGRDALVAVTKTGFFDHYNGVAGGIYGRLGFPVGNVATDANGTKTQEFKHGFLMKQSNGSVIEIAGKVLTAYRASTEAGAVLGAPIGPERTIDTSGGATFVQFETGVIVTPRATGTPVAIAGGIFDHYNSRLGGFGGAYGYPLGAQRGYSANGGGLLQSFQNGLVIVSTEANTVAGMLLSSPIYARYNGTEGGIYGWLGYPIADEVIAVDGTRSQAFQNGVISVGASGKTTVLPRQTAQLYETLGAAGGVLGAQASPTRSYAAGGGGKLSFFANGLISQTERDGIAASLRYDSPIYARYNGVEGGIFGWLGYPVAEEVLTGGVRTQRFQTGVIAVDARSRVSVLPVASSERYLSVGGADGALGVQQAPSRKYAQNGGAWLSFFGGGLIIESSDGSAVAVMRYDSPIYAYYNNTADGIFGPLGYPVADAVTSAGTTTQRFQNGTLVSSNGTVVRQ